MSDFSIYKQLEVARLSSNAQLTSSGVSSSGAANVVTQSHTRESFEKLANLAAATTETTEAEARPWPYVATLKTANVTPTSGAAVANTTDYSTINIIKRLASNQAAVVMATCNLSNVALTQWKSQPFVLVANAANYQIAAGDVITANVTLTGNGTANNLACIIDYTAEDV